MLYKVLFSVLHGKEVLFFRPLPWTIVTLDIIINVFYWNGFVFVYYLFRMAYILVVC